MVPAEIAPWLSTVLLLVVGFLVRDKLKAIEAGQKETRDEIRREVTPLRTDVAQLKALHVATERRLFVVESQLPQSAKLRDEDNAVLARWGKPTGGTP